MKQLVKNLFFVILEWKDRDFFALFDVHVAIKKRFVQFILISYAADELVFNEYPVRFRIFELRWEDWWSLHSSSERN